MCIYILYIYISLFTDKIVLHSDAFPDNHIILVVCITSSLCSCQVVMLNWRTFPQWRKSLDVFTPKLVAACPGDVGHGGQDRMTESDWPTC
jgi:hypothetical protein